VGEHREQTHGPWVAPTLVIGIGPWGSAVAETVHRQVNLRMAKAAHACSVISLSQDELPPDLSEHIRSALQEKRRAEVIRALERAGMIQLDPILAPSSHIYVVGSKREDPDLQLLDLALHTVSDAAAALGIPVQCAALYDRAGGDEPVQNGHRVYWVEPLTSHGMLLGPEEYRAAVVEALLVAIEPGGAEMLLAGPGGTLGIAWLDCAVSTVRARLAWIRTRDTLKTCLHTQGDEENGLRERLTQSVRSPSRRAETLLAGLPFEWNVQVDGEVNLLAPEGLFGSQRSSLDRYRRSAATLARRIERYERKLRQRTDSLFTEEAEALGRGLSEALQSGPYALEAAGRFLQMLNSQCNTFSAGVSEAHPQVGMRELHQALRRLPDVTTLLPYGAAGVAVWIFLGWLVQAPAWGLTAGPLLFGAASGLYHFWRLREIARLMRTAWDGLAAALTVEVSRLLHESFDRLDQELRVRAESLHLQLQAARQTLLTAAAQGPGVNDEPLGALHLPLIDGDALQRIGMGYRAHLPELVERIVREGSLLSFAEPSDCLASVEQLAYASVEEMLADDLGQLASQAYGDRLAIKLQEMADRLLAWSQSVFARHRPDGEESSWLCWPGGLPLPALSPEVKVVMSAGGTAAAVTVIYAGYPHTHFRYGLNRGQRDDLRSALKYQDLK
jgi:hypothetical protein